MLSSRMHRFSLDTGLGYAAIPNWGLQLGSITLVLQFLYMAFAFFACITADGYNRGRAAMDNAAAEGINSPLPDEDTVSV